MFNRIFLFMLSCFLIVITNQQYAQSADSILKRVENKIKSTKSFSYESKYWQVNSFVDDSVYQSFGKVWGKTVENDSIFGSYFHLKGKEKKYIFDYYYDGQKSIEFQHSLKEINIIDPYRYPNDQNNRAKARISLLPFVNLLIDRHMISTVYKDNPKVSIENGSKENDKRIIFNYPTDQYGQNVTFTITVDTKNYTIKKIYRVSTGSLFNSKQSYEINNFRINEPGIITYISLNQTFPKYKINDDVIQSETPKIESNIIGKNATPFTYKSFSNETISLTNYRGKLVLLDFWETWCGHCIVALPKINELHKKYAEKNLKIIGVTTENHEPIRKMIKNNNLLYTNVIGDKIILENYGVSARPTYILIDREGKIILVTYGNLDAIEKKIEENI